MKFDACLLVVFSILLIDQKERSSPTPERRDILESAPIISTMSTLTNYQHARNAIKIIFKVLSCHRSSVNRQCNKCFSWEIDPNDSLQTSYPISENYPLGPDEIIVEGEALKPPDSCRPGMKFFRQYCSQKVHDSSLFVCIRGKEMQLLVKSKHGRIPMNLQCETIMDRAY